MKSALSLTWLCNHSSATPESSSARHSLNATPMTLGSWSIVKWLPVTLAITGASVKNAGARSRTCASVWKVAVCTALTMRCATPSEDDGSSNQVSAACKITAFPLSFSFGASAEPRCRSMLYHWDVSWTCSRAANVAGLNTRRTAASCASAPSSRVTVSSCSANSRPSAATCESNAKLSTSPVLANAVSTSATSGVKCRGSIRATRGTASPLASNKRAISNATLHPKECPIKR
mmetsp:Transcript_21842/g.51002  ORF Transcript_21842/g.51002 Transcript_21842/m.51002 type:complete len:233 (-) Transcript_21842:2563-3261(-)